ncbi:MAG: bifunctional proline dehydrogenase/L-glutamate gamma-semialdehyde dehydrogenase [Lentisphaerales bacterium]|nr:bifunctional proline dehydrogenase/L-glutamate gamma-semialdehyde dehydrogenase [Lentisphaerales bacterium]
MLAKSINKRKLASQLQKSARQVSTNEHRMELAIELSSLLLSEANKVQSGHDKKMQSQLARMVEDLQGKTFTTNMTDECFRSNNSKRVANQLVYLIKEFGVPKYLDRFSKLQLSLFKTMGKPLSSSLIPLVKKLIRKETARVILPGEEDLLNKHIESRRKEGITTNLNHLGEAIQGEGEAKKKLVCYLSDLQNPYIEYISIKISTIYSQINMLAWEQTLEILKDRLRLLYREAIKNTVTNSAGETNPKFVNLDMEEYRDLYLTIELFKAVLSEDEFMDYKAGIVLQAYLPDSYQILKDLTKWAQERMARGGAPIKVRIVKGANLALEQIEASHKDWPQAPFTSKIEVDANYKKMLLYGTFKENAKAVNLGIASHNLFDISYAMILVAEREIEDYCNFEMLEGMAEHIRAVVKTVSNGLTLYCPTAQKHEFQHAIAYLIRRLDENTSPENFLRHSFNLKPDSEEFNKQADFFRYGCRLIHLIETVPRRHQNRTVKSESKSSTKFHNEADTDFALAANRQWADFIFDLCLQREFSEVPLIVHGQELLTEIKDFGISPNSGKDFFKYSKADFTHINLALKTAVSTATGWATTPTEERIDLLKRTAQLLRERRAEIISIMMIETGKHLTEADTELSEAIDFCKYYAESCQYWENNDSFKLSPIGPVLITSPWNFPCAIPLGGVVAALVTGNPVIFKPAPEAVMTGWHVVQALYDAGVSKKVLQFINCDDEPYGSMLISDKRIKACILTGATETAQLFLKLRPELNLLAETGGKNCMIITDMCDRDLAVADLIQSAFGHAGQKCSACSLAILEKNLYEDQSFLESIRDVAASMKVAPSYDPGSKINPLISPPNDKLFKALTTLEEGESWLLKPVQDPENKHLWSPGIKLGVQRNSFTFTTEFFGPVLGIVKADDLDHAIDMANSSNFALTGGIHSLDKREQEHWLSSIEVGNAYVNRGITGAIVQRQPFGGYKNSAFGRGFKAGGPNYLLQFWNISEKTGIPDLSHFPKELNSLKNHLGDSENICIQSWEKTIRNYQFEYDHYFTRKHDPSALRGQENYLVYQAVEKVTLILSPDDSAFDIYAIIAASLICKSPIHIVASEATLNELRIPQLKHKLISFSYFAGQDIGPHLHDSSQGRVRILTPPTANWQKTAAAKFCSLKALPVYKSGRLELLNYLRAMAVSDNYHRYGSLGNRQEKNH